MIQSETITDLLAALVEVQAELPTMPKSAQGYGYKYTDLDTITQTVKPILHKHGIAYMQSIGGVTDAGMTLTTRIFNAKGEYIEDTAALPNIATLKNNAAQVLGMSVSYMRRYMLCAMFGITSEEDTDACIAVPPTPQGANSAEKQAKKNAREKASEQLKGGDATPAENARIKELLKAKYANGTQIFTRAEVQTYSGYRKDKYTAQELIAFIENALRNRRADAPELPETKQTAAPIAGKQEADEAAAAWRAEQQAQATAPSFDTMRNPAETAGDVMRQAASVSADDALF